MRWSCEATGVTEGQEATEEQAVTEGQEATEGQAATPQGSSRR